MGARAPGVTQPFAGYHARPSAPPPADAYQTKGTIRAVRALYAA